MGGQAGGVGGGRGLGVTLADGPGTFLAPVFYPVGLEPYDLALADLDQDGDLDLCSADKDSNAVSVLQNLGDGSFTAAISYPVTPEPRALGVGDIDGDGHLDIVAASYTFPNLKVLLGLGDGGSPEKPGFVPYAVGLYAVVVVDLDQDGALDIVGVDRDEHEVVVMRNLGPGKLPTFDSFPVGLGPVDLLVADLDHDPRAPPWPAPPAVLCRCPPHRRPRPGARPRSCRSARRLEAPRAPRCQGPRWHRRRWR